MKKICIGILLWLMAGANILFAQDGNQTMGGYNVLTYQAGENCVVCGKLLADSDVVLWVGGQRVPLCAAQVNSFLKNQDRYLAKMQPKGALFNEGMRAPTSRGLLSGWFIGGLYILVALVFAGLSGYTAVSKGLPPMPNFFIGFFLSAFGYLYVLTRPAVTGQGEIPSGLVKVPTTLAPVPCPACGHANHPSSTKCVGCGGKLVPITQSEVRRA